MAGPAVVLLLLGTLGALAVRRMLSDAREIEATHRSIELLESLSGQLATAENRALGYLLIGRPANAEGFFAAVAGVRSTTAQVRRLADEPAEYALAETLDTLVEQHLDLLIEEVAAGRRDLPILGNSATSRFDRLRELSAGIAAQLGEIRRAYHARLLEQARQRRADARIALVALAAGTVASLAFAVTIGVLHDRHAQAQAEALAELDASNQQLQLQAVELEAASDALQESEERFRSLVENGSEIITILSADGRVVYQSPALARVLGYATGELEGTQLLEAVHPDDRAGAERTVAALLAGAPHPLVVTCRFRTRDGEWRLLESTGANRLDDPAIRGIVVNSRDVTEQHAAEAALHESQEQLWRAQKLEAIGRLAGGIAHDFNNLLTAIKGNVNLLLADAEDPTVVEDLREIDAVVDRARGLTRQLLAFGRAPVVEPQVVDLNDRVARIGDLLGRLIGEDVELRAVPAGGPALVTADPSQLDQVLLNLAVNARDAMPRGGVLRIEVERRADTVVLTVADTGHGMDADMQARIFEPFFTTKPQGTGLGLATVYAIVEQSGGTVHVRSAPGEGTTFRIVLPRAPEAVERLQVAPPDATRAARPATVLLVEDEPSVRAAVRRMLERFGYRVLDAPSADAAIRIADDTEFGFDLLLTDVVMPGMSGTALADVLRARRPQLPILYMSGYTDDAIFRHGVQRREVDFIEKPFDPMRLHARIQELLGG